MSKSILKLLTLVVVFVFLMSIVNACASNNGQNASSQTTGQTTSTAEQTTTVKETTPAEVPVIQFSIAMWGDATERSECKDYDQAKEAMNDKLAKDLGFKVDFIDSKCTKQNFRNLVQLAAADGQGVDVWVDGDYIIPDPQYNTIVYPITDLMDKYGSDIKNLIGDSPSIWKQVTSGGKIWGLPIYLPYNINIAFVRSDIVQELGLQMPADPYGATIDWF